MPSVEVRKYKKIMIMDLSSHYNNMPTVKINSKDATSY